MDLFLQLLKNGIVIGLLYGLFAYGLSLILSTSRIWHFAHGAVVVWASYIFWYLFQVNGLPVLLAVPLTFAGGAVLGAAFEYLLYRPLRRRAATEMVVLVASIVALTLLQNIVTLIFGSDPKAVQIGDTLRWSLRVGPVNFRAWDLLVLAASSIVFILVYWLQTKTELGLSFRAVGDNIERAETLGIRPEQVILWVFAIGSMIAAAPAMLIAVQTPLTPAMGFELLVKAIVVLIVGGIGSMPGALLGGILVGAIETLSTLFVPSVWAEFILFGVLFIFLLVQPGGLAQLRTQLA